MIELSDAEFQYDAEDATGLAAAQGVALVAGVLAVFVLGSHHIGIVDSFGVPLKVPYAGWIGPAFVVIALGASAAIPARFGRVWNDGRGRKRIATGLAQIAVTALVAAVTGFVLGGARLDLLVADQSLQAWLYYSLVVAGVAQLVIVMAAFALLALRRDLPDFVD